MTAVKGTANGATGRRLTAAAVAYALAMIALAVVGAFRGYTPVPYIDAWPGVVGFYEHAVAGDWFAWFAPYGLHPNTVAKLSFFLDMRFFSGLGQSLIVMNYLIVGLGAALLCLFLREATQGREGDPLRTALFWFVIGSAYYWSQWENFAWGFQVSFFWGQILPLAALFLFYRSLRPEAPQAYFAAACVAGALCIGTMANGVLALPCMLAVALALRQSRGRIVTLLLLSLGMSAAYLLIITKAGWHQFGPSLVSVTPLLHNPVRVVLYSLSFLGSVFSYVVGRGTVGKVTAGLMGAAFVGLLVLFCKREKYAEKRNVVLAGYLLYVLGTAACSTVARFTASTPITSRYTTVSLFGWLVLLVVFADEVLALLRKRRLRLLLACLPLAMLAGQTAALKSRGAELYYRDVQAIGEAMGANLQDPGLYNPWLVSARAAAVRRLGAYAIRPYRDVAEEYGEELRPGAFRPGAGGVDALRPLPDDPQFLAIFGRLSDAGDGRIPQLVRCVDASGRVVGFAFTGAPDVPVGCAGKGKGRSAFRGYVRSDVLGKTISLVGDDPQCRLTAPLPPGLLHR